MVGYVADYVVYHVVQFILKVKLKVHQLLFSEEHYDQQQYLYTNSYGFLQLTSTFCRLGNTKTVLSALNDVVFD